jgi:TPR repeat protein
MYYYGKGIDRNADLAENWLRKAANKGDSRACAMLKKLNEHKIHPIQKKAEAETETEDNSEDE